MPKTPTPSHPRLNALRADGWDVSEPFDSDGLLTIRMEKGQTTVRLGIGWRSTYQRTLSALLKRAAAVAFIRG